MNIGEIATQIYSDEFSGTSGAPTVEYISGWLSGNVGMLNNVIFTDLDPTGNFPYEESSIFKNLYLRDFYKKEAGKAMRGIYAGSASNLILKLKEGDSDIQFVNRNEVSKSLNSLSRQYATDLNDQITAYRLYQAYPRQVVGEDACYPDLAHGTGTGCCGN